MADRLNYARGTWTETRGPWDVFTRARAICPDGKARVVKLSIVADTFFSVPARLSYGGTTVAGFISFKQADWPAPAEQWVIFTPTGKHRNIFAPSLTTEV